jgi:hypothetical protein
MKKELCGTLGGPYFLRKTLCWSEMTVKIREQDTLWGVCQHVLLRIVFAVICDICFNCDFHRVLDSLEILELWELLIYRSAFHPAAPKGGGLSYFKYIVIKF